MKLIVATAAVAAAIGIAACAQDRFSEDERDGIDLSNTQNLPGSTENTDALCSDGVDNDGDTLVDCADANCYAGPDGGPTVCAVATESERPEFCADGLDNDGNGFVDCDDNDCKFNPATVCENTNEKCEDGVDNDLNDRVDCADAACQQSNDVTICPEENTNELCSNMVDDDSNGFTDCEDFSCSMNPMVTVCN